MSSLPTDLSRTLATLSARYADQGPETVLRAAIGEDFLGRIALVSSFGNEAAVLLALVAEVEPALPIIFLDTGKHFDETLGYRDLLIDRLDLKDVRSVGPEAGLIERDDRDGLLWRCDPDACCFTRKVLPLRCALAGFDAWITGRKRYQGDVRTDLPTVEAQDGKIKINPLAAWSRDRIQAEFEARDLPRHPLEAEGFLSIGCAPCTERVAPGADARSGRWAGRAKTECGIHFPVEAAVG